MNELDQKHVDGFFALVNHTASAHASARFCFVALKQDKRLVLMHARIFLLSLVATPPVTQFETETVVVANLALADLGMDAKTLLETVLREGTVKTPLGELQFPVDMQGRHTPYHMALHPEGIQAQRRISVLRVTGADHPPFDQTALDWEIKAANEPYDGLIELLSYFSLLPFGPGPNQIEFVATNGAEIGNTSQVNGETANIVVRLAKGLTPDKLRVGYRVRGADDVIVARASIPGTDFLWTTLELAEEGRHQLAVPKTATVNTIAVYDGLAQHHWWFTDPAASPNARRTVYETFDPRLSTLLDIVAKAQGKGAEAKAFESAVGWVFWLLGFDVASIGTTPRTGDAPDIIATTPEGHFLVVEVTTGLPKAEYKLANLHERAEKVRRSLADTGRAYVTVVPVLVTSKKRADVAVDLEQVERTGVYLVTGDEIPDIISRTALPTNVVQSFRDILQEIANAKAKYEAPNV